jgi:hypothetical protein
MSSGWGHHPTTSLFRRRNRASATRCLLQVQIRDLRPMQVFVSYGVRSKLTIDFHFRVRPCNPSDSLPVLRRHRNSDSCPQPNRKPYNDLWLSYKSIETLPWRVCISNSTSSLRYPLRKHPALPSGTVTPGPLCMRLARAELAIPIARS